MSDAGYRMLGAGAWGWSREMVLGGGFRIGNTCTPMADSCWCMAKPIQYCKVKLKKKRKIIISWLQSPLAVILEHKNRINSHCLHCLPIYLPRRDGTSCHDLNFLKVLAFSLSFFIFIKRLFSSSSLSAIMVVSSAYLRLLIFPPAI